MAAFALVPSGAGSMSSTNQTPFAFHDQPPALPPKPATPPRELQYMRAWSYVFENPQWGMNLLFGTIAIFIPVIGPMILNGYQLEIVEGLHRSGGARYPDFTFERFADYLVRGAWVFLVKLVAGLVMMPVFLAVYLGGFFVMALAGSAVGEEQAGVVFAIGMPLLILAIIVISLPLAACMYPMILRAGLAQDFAAAFNFGWIKSFVSKIWKEMILGALFLAITGMAVSLIGMMLFCVGMYPAIVLAMMAQAYMYYQFYELFLQRGGEPIPLKDAARQGW
jgi:hypothetical protein